MDTKKTIRKIFLTVTIAVAAVAMLTVLVAAISEKKKGQCSDYKITIKSNKADLFLDNKDVFKLLSAAAGGAVKGQQVSALNTRKLESILENNAWISDAQLYFDNKNVLHVAVTEREPVARLFTEAGNSFYIDSSMKRMPLSEKTSVRVPVFTGFPDAKKLSKKDSVLLKDVKKLAEYINKDVFWSSQTSAVDITEEKGFEMIPVVGNHLIKIGDATDLDRKFHNLFLFYKAVLSKTGFDKYKIIDAQFEGQIVTMQKTEKTGVVNKEQLKQNVQKLIKQSLEAQNDTLVTAKNIVTNTVFNNTDDRPALKPEANDDKKDSSPNPMKLSVKPNPEKKPNPKKITTVKGAKAVMPKKN